MTDPTNPNDVFPSEQAQSPPPTQNDEATPGGQDADATPASSHSEEQGQIVHPPSTRLSQRIRHDPLVRQVIGGVILALILGGAGFLWRHLWTRHLIVQELSSTLREVDELIERNLPADAQKRIDQGLLRLDHPALTPSLRDRFRGRLLTRQGDCFLILPGSEPQRQDNIERALTAYQSAARLATAGDDQETLGTAENGVGKAFAALARTRDREAYLTASIQAYQRALHIRTRAFSLRQYATTQNNLAEAYRDLADVRNPSQNFAAAFAANKAALEVFVPATFPRDYCWAQVTLGTIHEALALRGDSESHLEQALAAYERALDLKPLPVDPGGHAKILTQVAAAHLRLADIRHRDEDFEAAAEAYRRVLELLDPQLQAQSYTTITHNLGTLYAGWAEADESHGNQKRRVEHLDQAIERFRTSIAACPLATSPYEHAAYALDLVLALVAHAEARKSPADLATAEQLCNDAGRVYQRPPQPEGVATTQLVQGRLVALRGYLLRHPRIVSTGIVLLEKAHAYFTATGNTLRTGITEVEIGKAWDFAFRVGCAPDARFHALNALDHALATLHDNAEYCRTIRQGIQEIRHESCQRPPTK